MTTATMTPEAGRYLLLYGRHRRRCVVTEWNAHRVGKPPLCDCDWLLVLAEAYKVLGAACQE